MFSGRNHFQIYGLFRSPRSRRETATPDGMERGLHSGQAHHGRSLVPARQRAPQFPIAPLQVPSRLGGRMDGSERGRQGLPGPRDRKAPGESARANRLRMKSLSL
jgi:hypothetical protein